MSANYEIKTSRPDPYDLACSDCPVHYIDCWESISEEELRQLYAERMREAEGVPAWDEEWEPINPDFDGWLRQAIVDGYIRMAA